MDWTLEVVAVPVSDVDRAIAFYRDRAGFVLDHDTGTPPTRFAQLTPPGSGCSIVVGDLPGGSGMAPGSLRGLQLVVSDARRARALLVDNGVEASEVAVLDPRDGGTLFTFSDPDGNGWTVQQIAARAHPPAFEYRDLRSARFVGCDLRDAVMRGVDVAGLDLDSPWLLDGESSLLVNGVDVAPFVEAELNRRFPGRADRRATHPEGLRAAWARVEQTWAATLERVASMPPGSVDVCVDGEWSFAQTLRHLVMATDVWLGGAVLERDQPYHPIGQPNAEFEADGYDVSVFSTVAPSFAEVLDVRAGRVAMVRDFLATVTEPELARTRRNPWDPAQSETTLSCLHTILDEEWEHHRFAVRDLDALDGLGGDAAPV